MVNKKVFITGATGFIGRRLAFSLAEGNKVSILVRPKSIGKSVELKKRGVEIVLGDLLEPVSYSKKLNEVEYVFHLAALFKLEASKRELHRHNILGTQRLLESCINKSIKKIIYFSTAYVAGVKQKDWIREEEPYPKRFKNWYEWSKAESEKIALQFFKEHNLPITILRPSIVYGPGGFYGFYSSLKLISKKKLFVHPGNGENRVHLVHLDDVVQAAIDLAEKEGNAGAIYHICDDNNYNCSELVNTLCRELGLKAPGAFLPRFLARLLIRLPFCNLLFDGISPQLLDYFLYSQAYDNTKLKKTGYRLKFPSMTQGLKSTVAWYQSNNYLS